jgi:anthranilate/para-aminobenzoate synthase component I
VLKAAGFEAMSQLTARVVDTPPDPLALAEAIHDRPGAVLLWSADGTGPSYVACQPTGCAAALDPEPELELDPGAGPLSSVPRWIGLLPYEARRSLERPRKLSGPDLREPPHLVEPLWWRYRAVARVTDQVLVVGDDSDAVRELCTLFRAARGRAAPPVLAPCGEDEPASAHLSRIRSALELIAKGEIYQVNLARRLRFIVSGSPVPLLRLLGRRARPAFGAALAADGLDVACTSPELFLAVDPDRRIWTSPIKGTRPRGAEAREDAARAAELDTDAKERAELAMVLDVERNDLGRVIEVGSLRLAVPPRVSTHATLHHRAATLTARLRRDVTRTLLLEAMLPSGSVTGAPKIRAMEVIAELETARRGLYTGALGFISHDGGLRLAMAIRTLTVRDGEGHYFVGGGIVADSDPQRELEETRWKAVQLLSAVSP